MRKGPELQAEDLAKNIQFRALVLAGEPASTLAQQWGVGHTCAKKAAGLVRFSEEWNVPTVVSEVESSTDGSRTVTGIRDREVTLADAREWIESSGDNPDDYTLSIRSIAYGADMWSNRMSATPKWKNAGAPTWQPVTQAQPVNITVTPSQARAARPEGYQLAIKGADTQIGYRALPDGTYEPFHDTSAMNLFVAVCELYQPDDIDILGDFIDLPSQSRWAQEAGFARTTQRAIDTAYHFLARLRAACPDATVTIIEGNHDKRMQSYIETNALAAYGLRQASVPEGWPVMSLPFLLRLNELGIEYVDAYPAATKWDNENVRNIHGTKANSKGSTTSQYVHEIPNVSTWAGHTHRPEITWKNSLGAGGQSIVSYSANPGCLCRTDGAVPSVNSAITLAGDAAQIVENWTQGIGFNYYNEHESHPNVYRIQYGTAVIDGNLIRA